MIFAMRKSCNAYNATRKGKFLTAIALCAESFGLLDVSGFRFDKKAFDLWIGLFNLGI